MQFRKNVRSVELHRTDADVQEASYFPIREPSAHHFEDFVLARRRSLPGMGVPPQHTIHFTEEVGEHLRRNPQLIGDNTRYRSDEHGSYIRMWNVPVSAHNENSHDLIPRLMVVQHEELCLRALTP